MGKGRTLRRLTACCGVSVAVLALVLVVVGAGSAAPPPGAGKPDRAAVVAYWSSDRVSHAIPRDVAPDRRPSFAPRGPEAQAGKPGGGGGGGGGGTTPTTVTGAPWTGGGKVKITTGKVLFTMASVDYVCSGSVVDDGNASADSSNTRSLVLTAGHCVFDEEGSGFATNWMFVPDYENGGSITTGGNGSHAFNCQSVPYGCWTASALVTTSAWASGGGSLAGFNNDYAFAVLSPGGKSGESKQLDATVGANPIVFGVSRGTQVYAFGYPQASPYDGQKLIYCAGADITDTWGGTSDRGLNCNQTGGSSGGPWFTGFNAGTGTGALTSVNSFKYTSGKFTKYMFGPYFGSYTQTTWNVAKTATSNTAVAP